MYWKLAFEWMCNRQNNFFLFIFKEKTLERKTFAILYKRKWNLLSRLSCYGGSVGWEKERKKGKKRRKKVKLGLWGWFVCGDDGEKERRNIINCQERPWEWL